MKTLAMIIKINRIKLIIISIAVLLSCNASSQEFRTLKPDQVLVLDTSEGMIYVELSAIAAPKHVAQIKKLAADKFYDNQSFYRVIDGFVAQGGYEDDETNKVPTLPMEAEFDLDKLPLTLVQEDDMFAAHTGFIKGFPVGMDAHKNVGWFTHCPGVMALARGNEPDTGNSDFYFVIGQAPRYLDRIMTIFGRVVWGMDVVQRMRRGKPEESGVIANKSERSLIHSVRLMSDLPKLQQAKIEVEKTHGKSFKEKLDARRKREHAFFYKKPPPVLDVCQIPLASKITFPK